MRVSTTLLTAAASVALALVAVVPAHAETLYGVLNNDPAVGDTLVTIDSDTRAVTGSVLLGGGPLEPIGSIDFRPATGTLYGLGSNSRQLYTINTASGALTPIGAPLPIGGLIDFNPVADAIRLVPNNTTNTNYRINPDTGAVIAQDGDLAYQSGDVNAGNTPNVHGIGYTNSVAGATSTTLYDVDVDADVLATQTPANDGTLQTVGALGADLNSRGLFGTFTGFDISGATGTAYLTDGPFGGTTDFYTVDLATGIATNLGTISGLGDRTVADIAVAPIPEPASLGLLGLGATAPPGSPSSSHRLTSATLHIQPPAARGKPRRRWLACCVSGYSVGIIL